MSPIGRRLVERMLWLRVRSGVHCAGSNDWMVNMVKGIWRLVFVCGLTAGLLACTPSHVLVPKSDMEAADQCLLAQQRHDRQLAQQQLKLVETLELLRANVELQQQGDQALRDFMQAARRGLESESGETDCDTGRADQGNWPVPDGALDKVVVGATERVLLPDLTLVLPARIDTGAELSLLAVRQIKPFERNGEQWVRFKLPRPEGDEPLELERPQVRRARLATFNGDKPKRHPVVELRLTLGSITQRAELALVEELPGELSLRIGRNVLRDLMLVDVARENVVEPPEQAPAGDAAESPPSDGADKEDSSQEADQ